MTDSGPVRPLNPVVRAAFALHRRPGGYVALLGAGISKPTGIKSAWEILSTLIGRVAVASGDTPDDPVEWWSTTHHTEAAYGEVLEAIAATPDERRAVLAEFFEPTASEVDAGLKLPSAAHRELAQLVAGGYLRIILTLNFDHLMEQALRDAGIQPTVVASPAAMAAMEPLHAQQCVVVHLHGEFRSPELLNTPGELAEYDPAVELVVRQIAAEYGLLVVGWSATWDAGLVDLLTPATTPRFSTWWIEPGETNDVQRRLGSRRLAEFIDLNADQAMTRIGAALEAVVNDAAKSTPLDVAIGISAMKRELRRGALGVDSHDLVRRATHELSASPIARPARYELESGETVQGRSEAVLGEIHPAAAFVATLAYWGDGTTDRWWFDELERLAMWPHASGNSALIDLARSPSIALFYAAGVAAVAAERWQLVLRLLTEPQVENPYRGEQGPLVSILAPSVCDGSADSSRLARFVAGLLHGYVGLGAGHAVDAWERFEYLAALTAGPGLPWYPTMRVSGSTGSRNAVPALWLDTHLSVIQPFLNAPGWIGGGGEVTTRRTEFDAAFTTYASRADFQLLPPGTAGMLPSGRHYPGQFTDQLDLDTF